MIHLDESSNGHDLELPVGEVFELASPKTQPQGFAGNSPRTVSPPVCFSATFLRHLMAHMAAAETIAGGFRLRRWALERPSFFTSAHGSEKSRLRKGSCP